MVTVIDRLIVNVDRLSQSAELTLQLRDLLCEATVFSLQRLYFLTHIHPYTHTVSVSQTNVEFPRPFALRPGHMSLASKLKSLAVALDVVLWNATSAIEAATRHYRLEFIVPFHVSVVVNLFSVLASNVPCILLGFASFGLDFKRITDKLSIFYNITTLKPNSERHTFTARVGENLRTH